MFLISCRVLGKSDFWGIQNCFYFSTSGVNRLTVQIRGKWVHYQVEKFYPFHSCLSSQWGLFLNERICSIANSFFSEKASFCTSNVSQGCRLEITEAISLIENGREAWQYSLASQQFFFQQSYICHLKDSSAHEIT